MADGGGLFTIRRWGKEALNHREGKNTKKSKRHKKQADFNEIELHTNN